MPGTRLTFAFLLHDSAFRATPKVDVLKSGRAGTGRPHGIVQ